MRGVPGNRHPYRDRGPRRPALRRARRGHSGPSSRSAVSEPRREAPLPSRARKQAVSRFLIRRKESLIQAEQTLPDLPMTCAQSYPLPRTRPAILTNGRGASSPPSNQPCTTQTPTAPPAKPTAGATRRNAKKSTGPAPRRVSPAAHPRTPPPRLDDPAGPAEEMLVCRIAANQWRLDRAHARRAARNTRLPTAPTLWPTASSSTVKEPTPSSSWPAMSRSGALQPPQRRQKLQNEPNLWGTHPACAGLARPVRGSAPQWHNGSDHIYARTSPLHRPRRRSYSHH